MKYQALVHRLKKLETQYKPSILVFYDKDSDEYKEWVKRDIRSNGLAIVVDYGDASDIPAWQIEAMKEL